MSIIKEFRDFAVKGNFIDLAVGVILGASSGKVVNTLVENIFMPPIGLLTGRVNFNELRFVLQEATLGPDGKELSTEVAIGYGAALQSLFELIIIAFVVFIIVRSYNRFRTAAEAVPPAPSVQEKLLEEIRDLLKSSAAKG